MSEPVLMPVSDTPKTGDAVPTGSTPIYDGIVKEMSGSVKTEDDTAAEVRSFMPDALYEFLKWLALIVLYAVATFVGAVGPAWGWPHVNEIVLTLTAAGTLLGAILGVAKATAK